MKDKQTSRRNLRKGVMRRFEESFDVARLDYARRTKPGKGEAKLFGVIAAAIVYFGVFGLSYYSWSQQLIDDLVMNKLVWIMMIPTSLVGALAWLISANRKEFPIREDIRAHIRQFEGDEGTLWRYAPILNGITLKKIDMELIIEFSQEGRLEKSAPEDVCAVVHALHQALANDEVKPALLSEIEANFEPKAAA